MRRFVLIQDMKNESTGTINGSKKYKSLRPNVIYRLLSLCLSQSHTSSLKPHFNSRIPHFDAWEPGQSQIILYSSFHSCPCFFTTLKSIPITARLFSEPSVVHICELSWYPAYFEAYLHLVQNMLLSDKCGSVITLFFLTIYFYTFIYVSFYNIKELLLRQTWEKRILPLKFPSIFLMSDFTLKPCAFLV